MWLPWIKASAAPSPAFYPSSRPLNGVNLIDSEEWMLISATMKTVTLVIQILCINIGYTLTLAAGGQTNDRAAKYQRDESVGVVDGGDNLQRATTQNQGAGGHRTSLGDHQQHQQQQQQRRQQQQRQQQQQQRYHQHHQQRHVASSSSQFGTSAELSLEDDQQQQQQQQHQRDIIHNTLNRGPTFDRSASSNVTALVGKTAYLNCRILNLGNKTVTWIRHRDLHLLTVDKATYTSDQRFVSVHNAQMGDWTLQVRYPQRRDSGVYECQVSTTPPTSNSMILSVVEPITTIHGAPDLYIDTGSTVNLTCIVRHLPEPPSVIQWTHNNQEINYDSARGGVSVITEKGEITTSYLLIQRARISDSGKYTCLPTHANPQTVNVHVLNGEEPAAIQRGSHLSGTASLRVACPIFVVFIVRLMYAEEWRY